MAVSQAWLKRVPQPGETCVFSQSKDLWRRDALMFDRVYAPLLGELTSMYPGPRPERMEAPDIPMEFSFSIDQVDEHINWSKGVTAHGIGWAMTEEEYEIRREQEVESQYRGQGIMGTWCASDRGLYFKRFSEGQVTAYQGALNNLPIVSTDVPWEQVRQFRNDKQAVRKYRDLRLWLTEGLGAQSERHATDIVGQRIDDYRWAIRKHGLGTVTGTLTNLWDWKQSAALLAGVGAAATVGSAAVGALFAGLAITSGIGAFFAERKLSKEDVIRGDGREVAVLVDIQNQFGS